MIQFIQDSFTELLYLIKQDIEDFWFSVKDLFRGDEDEF